MFFLHFYCRHSFLFEARPRLNSLSPCFIEAALPAASIEQADPALPRFHLAPLMRARIRNHLR